MSRLKAMIHKMNKRFMKQKKVLAETERLLKEAKKDGR